MLPAGQQLEYGNCCHCFPMQDSHTRGHAFLVPVPQKSMTRSAAAQTRKLPKTCDSALCYQRARPKMFGVDLPALNHRMVRHYEYCCTLRFIVCLLLVKLRKQRARGWRLKRSLLPLAESHSCLVVELLVGFTAPHGLRI